MNKKSRRRTGVLTQRLSRCKYTKKFKTTIKNIQNKTKTIKHFCEGLYGKKEMFWLKNEITNRDILSLCKGTTLIGKKASNTTHNTNKDTVRLKKATDYLFYYKKDLPNDKTIYLHVGRYKETGNLYLYDATDYNPIKK